MLFYIIYTNYDQKGLAGVRKTIISWEKFKKHIFGKTKIASYKKKEKE